jgi:hypothetical protein
VFVVIFESRLDLDFSDYIAVCCKVFMRFQGLSEKRRRTSHCHKKESKLLNISLPHFQDCIIKLHYTLYMSFFDIYRCLKELIY